MRLTARSGDLSRYYQRLIRGTALIYAALFFFWIGYEDQSLAYVTALGAGAALLLTAHALAERRAAGWAALGLGGLAAGLLAAPITAMLMLMKVSLHSHAAPDFSLTAVVGILARAPVWAAAGLAAGLGFGIIHRASRPPGH